MTLCAAVSGPIVHAATSAQLDIDGVPLSLRALDLIGYRAAYDRLWEDLRRETGFRVTPA